MKANWLWLLLGLALVFGLAMACGGGDDDDDDNAAGDDDNNGDDDSGDDDDDNDDNDDSGDDDLGVQNASQSDCLDDAEGKVEIWDPMEDPIDVVQVAWDNGVLKIEDLFAYANCGFELEVAVALEGNVVTVTENDIGTPADCMCPFNLNYEITGIPAGDYTLRIERTSLKAKAGSEIFEFALTLGADNFKWYVPYIELFASGDTTTQPYQARIAACNLYHLEDQRFYVSGSGDLYHVFAYDWYDLDNPGSYDPTCQIPVMVDIGNLDAGSYYFGAPSYNEGEWSMLTFEADIE